MYLDRVFQFYTVPRVIRLTGNDNANNFFRFSIENDRQEDGSVNRTAVVQNVKAIKSDEEGDESYQILESPERRYEVIGNFDVKVATGSLLPFSKAEKEQKLLNMYDRGIIDKEEVLKGIDFPNWEAILQRVQEQEAAQAQAAQGQPPQ